MSEEQQVTQDAEATKLQLGAWENVFDLYHSRILDIIFKIHISSTEVCLSVLTTRLCCCL